MCVKTLFKPLLLPALLLGLLTLLPACTLMSSGPSRVYQLAPNAAPLPTSAAALPVSLRLVQPASVEPLSGEGIVQVVEGQQVQVSEQARWIAPAPRMLRDYLLDAFSRDGRIAHISHDGGPSTVDYELAGTLNAFQTELPADQEGTQAVIRLHLQLVDMKRDLIIASRYFEYTAPVADDNPGQPDAMISAFSEAARQLAVNLPGWTVQKIRLSRQNHNRAKLPLDNSLKSQVLEPSAPAAITF